MIEVYVHDWDGSPCDRDTGDPMLCGHGHRAHYEWVPAEPPC